MKGTRIGTVTHFFGDISVAVIDLTDTIRLGDVVHFLGSTTDFRQEVVSLQIEHEAVEQADPGQDVAIKVERRVRKRDKLFKLID